MTSLQPPHDNASSTYELIIRFSASLPDLPLSIPASRYATTSTLKAQVRRHLPEDLKKRRIRLICAGKALADDSPLENVFRTRSHVSSPRSSTPAQEFSQKGKSVIRDPPSSSHIYVHCSVGDLILSPEELVAEHAQSLPQPPSNEESTTLVREHDRPSLTPAPRGFDRLLNAGFTMTEVSSLRLQFLAIQAHTHTPDSMPSPNTMRLLEDRWLDNSNNVDVTNSTASPEDTGGALDDLLIGTTCGFFWPIGCLLWAGREDGIWTRRRKIAVVMGVIMNIAAGVLRWMR